MDGQNQGSNIIQPQPQQSEVESSQAQPPSSNNKSKIVIGVIVGLILVLIVAAGASGYYFYKKSRFTPQPKTLSYVPSIAPTSIPNATPTPTSLPNSDLSKLGDFPIYETAQFTEFKPHVVCDDESYPPDSPCKNDRYVFSVKDSFANVSSWYDEPKSGWTCSGGAGFVEDSSLSAGRTSSFCSKEGLTYSLHINGDLTNVELIVGIPIP